MNIEAQGTRLLVLEAIRNFPKSTTKQLAEILPEINMGALKSMCQYLYREGALDVELGAKSPGRGGKRPHLYSIAENPQPRRLKPSAGKTKKPSVSGYEAREQALREQIDDLEQWKRNAIARYPDLAIPEVVLRARKIVAEQLESHDSHGKAETLAGRRDHTTLIKAVVAALEQG